LKTFFFHDGVSIVMLMEKKNYS